MGCTSPSNITTNTKSLIDHARAAIADLARQNRPDIALALAEFGRHAFAATPTAAAAFDADADSLARLMMDTAMLPLRTFTTDLGDDLSALAKSLSKKSGGQADVFWEPFCSSR